MSKFVRMTDVLDLFSESDTLLTAEMVAARLQLSRPTAFRYLRELSTAGFLANYSGHYSLGARIIMLDYRIRQSDPLLKAARDPLQHLSDETGFTSFLCRMYNDEVVNVHQQVGRYPAGEAFARGHPMPMFRGAPSQAMLAFLPPARLRKICEKHMDDPDLQRLGADWPAQKAHFSDVRKRGYYLSEQELEAGAMGLAVPILMPPVGLVGSIALVFDVERRALINIEGCAALAQRQASEIARRLAELGAGTRIDDPGMSAPIDTALL